VCVVVTKIEYWYLMFYLLSYLPVVLHFALFIALYSAKHCDSRSVISVGLDGHTKAV
jgi:hypothetical protein